MRRAVPEKARRPVLKWVGIAAAVPMVVLVVLIAGFIARTEFAHDESRCPFDEIERRDVGAEATVVDQRRSCQEGVIEHRWVVERRGDERELGRRRLHADLFGEDRYRWSAELQDGWVHVDIHNDGIEPAHFREGPE